MPRQSLTPEARREQTGFHALHGDPRALLRAFQRLILTQIMAARSVTTPLPSEIANRLAPSLDEISAAVRTYCGALSQSLVQGSPLPEPSAVETALERFGEAMAAVRRDGMTRLLPDEVAERVFSLGFALHQMGRTCATYSSIVRNCTPR